MIKSAVTDPFIGVSLLTDIAGLGSVFLFNLHRPRYVLLLLVRYKSIKVNYMTGVIGAISLVTNCYSFDKNNVERLCNPMRLICSMMSVARLTVLTRSCDPVTGQALLQSLSTPLLDKR